jgi:hypothetical protein
MYLRKVGELEPDCAESHSESENSRACDLS